jgi:hypothetical protein
MNILDLGKDVLYNIFSHVKDKYTQQSIIKTCKTFNSIGHQLALKNIWYSKFFLHHCQSLSSIQNFNESTRLDVMAVYGINRGTIIDALDKKKDGIERLTLYSIVYAGHGGFGTNILPYMNKLTRLSLHKCRNIEALRLGNVQHLTRLTITHNMDSIILDLSTLTLLTRFKGRSNESINITFPRSIKYIDVTARVLHINSFDGLELDILKLDFEHHVGYRNNIMLHVNKLYYKNKLEDIAGEVEINKYMKSKYSN